jgi:DNA ligase-1
MVDTEVTLVEGTTEDRTKVSGMINSARSGTKINEDILVFNAFDLLSLYEFESCSCASPYCDRLINLRSLLGVLPNTAPIKLAETYIIRTPEKVQELYADMISKNQEGLILKSPSHFYSFKRSPDWAKLKEVKTADLLCVDFEFGEGKYDGMIGALVCEGLVEGKKILVRVGSGLTDADRLAHPSDYLAHTIELKYNSVIQDSRTKQWSLFLPRFVQVRFDK